jgi:hypothetical protein
MRNETIYHNIPSVAFTILEFVGCTMISFVLGIVYERARCCRRRGVDLNV